jgi:cytochrome c5
MNGYKFLPLIMVAIAASLAGCEQKAPVAPAAPSVSAAAAPTEAAPATAPAAAPTPAAAVGPAPSAEVLAKGEKIYTATCVACHGAGVLGAPKFGDKAAWQPRIAKGMDALYSSSLNGIKMMPPRGGNAALKDDELKAAVDYMVSKAS